MPVDDPASRLEPVHARHPDVHQDDTGPKSTSRLDSLRSDCGFGDDLEVGSCLEDLRQPDADERLVIGDEHTGAHVERGCKGSVARNR